MDMDSGLATNQVGCCRLGLSSADLG